MWPIELFQETELTTSIGVMAVPGAKGSRLSILFVSYMKISPFEPPEAKTFDWTLEKLKALTKPACFLLVATAWTFPSEANLEVFQN
ncbi:hypothetical protein WICPIJ_005340 [Wickerhamomyces pijperi]|uniref:Uncharacterized protein n=1 Tax=Wickerhamomyces pijperi TaxID=599730 RepID=A0A9P8TLW6_WICPI|nr:hypothetical protein WICPIJ_005340 [Wickerhamomyces pijperi]